MEIIQTDGGTHFISNYFQEVLSIRGVRLSLVAQDHHNMNGQFEVTWQKLRTISHSIMVHKWVSDKYIHFS